MNRWIVSLLPLMAVTLLHAESFGVQANMTFPSQDLKQDMGSKGVLSGGAFLFLDEYDGDVLKPRIDISTFHQSDYLDADAGKGHALNINMASLGLDYNYYFSQKGGEGWYLLLGGQVGMAQSTWNAPDSVGQCKDTRISAAYSVGFGTVFMPHCGVEVRYTAAGHYSNYNLDGSTNAAKMSTISAGLVFLF